MILISSVSINAERHCLLALLVMDADLKWGIALGVDSGRYAYPKILYV